MSLNRGATINSKDEKQVFTYAIDTNGEILQYWAGADDDHLKSCACGLEGTCALPERKCNCDSNDDVWRYDEGYVADKTKLPLRSIKAGDTGLYFFIFFY